MKKIIFFLVSIVYVSVLNATIITVDNNYPMTGQFATLQEAHVAANSGDTIYIYPSSVNYQGITVSKRLIIIGSGYEEISNIKASIILGEIIFNQGSAGSSIEGFLFQSHNHLNMVSGIIINSSDILIKRNKMMKILINSNLTGTIILNNFIYDVTSPNYNIGAIQVEDYNEILIQNNLIIRISYGNDIGMGIRLRGQNISGLIINNVIKVLPFNHSANIAIDRDNSNCLVYNNITEYGQYLGNYGSSYSYNICGGVQLLAERGNIPNTKMVDVFIDPDNYDFHLKTGSPAIGSGFNGVDMGIYGGDTPFIDGGYPAIPSIYFLEVPLTVSKEDGLEIKIKAKTNK